MRIIKLFGKWLAILVLAFTMTLAVIVPGLGVYARVDGPLFAQLLTSSLIIIAACIFLICLLGEYKP